MIELNTELIVEDLEEKTRLDVFLSDEVDWSRLVISKSVLLRYQFVPFAYILPVDLIWSCFKDIQKRSKKPDGNLSNL